MKKKNSQLDSWVNGISIHDDVRGECCPDFSCCKPELLVNEETRFAFARAYYSEDDNIINEMLMVFLSSMLLLEGANAYVCGVEGYEDPS